MAIAALLFIAWAGIFIYRSSFTTITGIRYFSLFDDAMISMRYAWNFSHGHGLVWNDGVYTEGITNMLMTLYMAIPTFLFDKRIAVLFVQVSGIVFMLGIGLLTMGIAQQVFKRRRMKDDTFYSLWAFIAGVAYYPLAYWTLMGMETGLLTILLLAGLLLALRTEARVRAVPALAIVLGLAFVTRPDALIPIVIILAYRWLNIIGQKGWWRVAVIEGAIVSAFVVSLTAFRVLYYGSPVPNTYILKATGMPLGISLANGLTFVTPFLESIALPGLIVAVLLVLRPRRHSFLLLLLLIASILYQIWAGGESWPYWRMMSPFMPLLFVVSLEALRTFSNRWFPVRPFVVIGLLIVLMSVNLSFAQEAVFTVPPFQSPDNQTNVNTALILQQILRPGATVAMFWAGSIPYYTGFGAIDMLGKSDRYIAQLPPDLSGAVGWNGMSSVPGHNKYDLTYSILKLQPTYAQGLGWGSQNVTAQAHDYIHTQVDGYNIYLKMNAPEVDWNKLEGASSTSSSGIPEK